MSEDISKLKWIEIKEQFNNLSTYLEQLEWWARNIPKIDNRIRQYQYSSDDAPILLFDTIDFKIENGEPHYFSKKKKMKDYISILPDSDNLKLFWQWIIKIEKVSNSEDVEIWFKEQLLKAGKVFESKLIEEWKLSNEQDRVNYSQKPFFRNGYNYGVFYDEYYLLRFPFNEKFNPNVVSLVYAFIKGYECAMEERALISLTTNPISQNTIEKIKWLGTPSQFSYLMLELAKRGFIEQPLYRGETSPSRYAELCYNNFEIETTLESLKTEFKKDSSLTDVYRAKFTIPDKIDITDKRSGKKKTTK